MDKTRQERYNMIYGNTARKIEDLAAYFEDKMSF